MREITLFAALILRVLAISTIAFKVMPQQLGELENANGLRYYKIRLLSFSIIYALSMVTQGINLVMALAGVRSPNFAAFAALITSFGMLAGAFLIYSLYSAKEGESHNEH